MNKNLHILLFSLLLTGTVTFAQTPQYINTNTLGGGNSWPMNATATQSNKCQWLYAPGEFIGATSGNIMKIYIRPAAATTSATYTDLTVKIGYTSITSLTSGPWITSGMQSCYYATSTTFTSVVANNWLPIQLQVPFFYDPTRYIIIELSQSNLTGTGFTVNQWSPGTGNRRMYGSVLSTSSSGADGTQAMMGIDVMSPYRVDAGISAIKKPVGPITPGIDTVKAIIFNYGKDTLKTTALRWSVDNVGQSPPSNWSGSLTQYTTSGQVTFGTFNFTNGIHTIKAWTANPNSATDSNPINDTAKLVLYSCSPASGTYVIDPSGSGDFLNFTAALTWIKNCGVSGAVTFRAKPATYTEQLTIPVIPGASLINTITFESYNLDSTSVILTYASTGTTDNYVVKLDGADYITFRKMTMRATGASYGRVVEFANAADYNSLRNNVLQTLITTSSNHAVIYSYTTLDQYNTIKDNVISGGYYGIYWYGVSTTSQEIGNLIEGNDIKDFNYYGIISYYQNAIIIRKNTVTNSTASTSVYGIYAYYCYNNIDISGNNVNLAATTTIYGLYLYYNTGTTTLNGKVSNNFISLGGSSTGTYYGMYLGTPAYQNLSYNTINIYGTASTSKYCLYLSGGTAASVNLRNNILANFCTGYAIYIGTTATISTSNYNDLFTNGTNLGYWATNCTNLAAWRTASAKDANSVSVNPGFYSTTDLHVNTSGISNLGTPVSGITTDFDGESRNATTPDIGADEFDLASYDAGATKLVSPLQPCPGTNTLTATIKNYGLNALTSVTVNWKVNGATQTPVTPTVSLSQYQETTITLGTYSFTAGTIYNIKIWTSQPNGNTDGNNRNDTLLFKNLQTSMTGTYTIGGSSANYATFNAAVNDLKARGICSAVLFRVNPGNYTECVNIPFITGATKNNTITFESYNHDSTSVDLNYASTGTTDNYVVQLNGADYVTFRQIKIRATGTTYGIAVNITGGADYNTFANNIILTLPGATSSNFTGIYSTSTLDNYNSIVNNIISGGYYGLYMYGAGSTSLENMNVIKNNWIKDFYYYGLLSYYQNSNTIEGNRIQNHSSSTTSYGLYLGYNNDTIKITKNRIELTAQTTNICMYVYYCTGTATTTGLVANNFLSQTGATSTTGSNYGFYIYYSNYQNIYNNSVNTTANSGINNRAVYVYYGTYINLRNNIMASTGGGYAMYVTTGTNVSVSDYNDLYTTGSILGYWNSDQPNLSSWKLVTAQDAHSVSADPYFYTSTDLHAYSQFLDSAGIPLFVVKTDIDGQPRNTTKPDIGADEFTVFNRDAGIVQLVEPIAPCPGTPINIIVKMRNFGLVNINSLKIKWTVNGIPQTTKNYSGNLANHMDTNIYIGTYSFNPGTSYNLKFWTDTIDGFADQMNRNDTLLIKGMRAAKSGTYTIGRTGRDYATFNAAVSDLILNGVCGPVTFVVDTGAYNEQITIPSILGASAANRITFTSASNDSSLVDLNFSSTATTNNYVVELNGADYITFNKIKIRSSGFTYARTVHIMAGADYNTFSSNMILSLPGSTGSNASGIFFESASPDNYNIIRNNYIRGGYYGIYLYGTGSTTRENFNVIKNNIIKDFYYYGLISYYQNSPELSGNLIENSSATTSCYGLYSYYNYDTIKIERNRINLSGSATNYCMYIYYATGTPVTSALIANNSISQTGISTGTNYGMYINSSSYLNIYNNSVNITAIASGNSMALYFTGGSVINIRNNIFAGSGDGYAVYISSTGVFGVSDYNDLFTNGPYVGYWGGANIISLAAWKTVSTQDAHSVSTDPYFYSKTDLHPYSTALDSSALPLTMIKTDIDYKIRNATHPDMGAYEFSALDYDAGITALVEPSPPCPGVLSNVVVKLRNYGYRTILSTKIKWTVNDTFQTPFNFSGSLSKLKDTSIFIGTYIFYSGTTYKIKVWADSINSYADQNHRNDTLFKNGITPALSGTLRIGPVGKDYTTFTSALNDLKLRGVCNKVTFLVDAGTYTEQISIPPIFGVSDTKTITFRSASGDSTSVILSYAATGTADNYTVQLNGADYISFEKMTIRSTAATYAYVVDIRNGADHNIFRNNIIQSIATTGSYAAPVYSTSTSDNYNIIENNRLLNGYYGVYIYGVSTASLEKGNVIRNNQITGFYYYGIMSYYQDSVEINKNVITNSTSSSACYGIYSYYNYYNTQIVNNQILLNSTSTMYGMYVNYLTGSQDKIPLIANNFISLSGTYTGTVYGLYSYYCLYNNIFHNSINIACGSSSGMCLYLYGPTTANYGYIDLRNNILVNSATGYAIYLPATSVTGNYLRTSDYNDLYTKGTNLGYYGSSTVTTLAAWRTASSKDLNSISINAPFTTATNLHLTSYSSFSISNPLTEVPYDIDGNLRSKKKPLMGADERPPILNDAGITGFVSPKMVSCDGTLAIKVILTNFGTKKLTSVRINTKINGVSLPAYFFAGSLNSLADTTIFIAYRNFTYGTNYKIFAGTVGPNGVTDVYADNNNDSIQNLKLLPFPVIKSTTNDSICKGNIATLSVSSLNSTHFFWYDSLYGGTLIAEAPSIVTDTLYTSRTYYVEAGTKGSPDSLMTSKLAGSAEMGNMFDVQAINSDIIIDSFSIQPAVLAGIPVPMAVYYRKGSYVGYESKDTAWTLLGIDTVISKGVTNFVSITIGNLKINAGDTFGFYVSSTDFTALLTHTEGAKVISDNYIKISCGTKAFFPFDSYFSPGKTWNGKIFYSTGSLCKSARKAVEAFVKPLPAKDLGPDVTICSGKSTVFKTRAFSEYSYAWKEASKPVILSYSDSLVANAAGTYIVNINDQCGYSATDSINLLFHPLPQVKFTINDATQCFKGNKFNFINNSSITKGVISGYTWNFGDNTINHDTNTRHIYTIPDTYKVKLKAISNFGCEDSQSVSVSVYPQPIASFTIKQDNQCFRGNYFEFTDASTVINGKITGYIWDFGDMVKNYDTNTTHVFTTEDSFNVMRIVATSDGCFDSTTKKVVVYPQSKAAFSVNDTSQCLSGNSFIITNNSTIKSGTMVYSWKLGDGDTTSKKNLVHSYTTIGTYQLQLNTTTDHGCMDSVTSMVYVKPHPVVNLGKDTTLKHNQTISLDAGAGMDSYLWSTTASTQQITVDTTGVGDVGTRTIWVKVEKNGCFGYDTALVHFIHNYAISEGADRNLISVYPNPATNEIFISSSIPSGKYMKVTILNEYGKVVSEVFSGSNNGKWLRVDATTFSSGVYFVKIESGSDSRLAKVVIIK